MKRLDSSILDVSLLGEQPSIVHASLDVPHVLLLYQLLAFASWSHLDIVILRFLIQILKEVKIHLLVFVVALEIGVWKGPFGPMVWQVLQVWLYLSIGQDSTPLVR